jgi:alcohol dehydrogenase class IV
MSQDYFEFQLGPRVICKPGLVDELGHEMAAIGGTRALIVTDQGCVRAGLLDRVQAGVATGVEVVGVFSDVPPNSSLAAVEKGATYGQQVGADLIIALGGGSPIDTAKAIALLLTEGGDIRDYQGYNLLTRPLTPLVIIPTTAGTGSEVTSWAVIRDEDNGLKIPYSSPFLAPRLAVLDPELTRSLPPRLTAATGMDAMTHAIESYVSTNSNVITDCLALQAIDMISNYLRAATHNGQEDLEARMQMLVASTMAGMAFSGGGGSLGIVHAMAHSIGGLYEIHHGTLNALLLPYGMRFNAPAAPIRFARIARAMGVNVGGRSEPDVIEEGIEAVHQLNVDCGLPTRLRDLNVPETALEQVAELSIGDPAIFANPRPNTVEDILDVLRSAW